MNAFLLAALATGVSHGCVRIHGPHYGEAAWRQLVGRLAESDRKHSRGNDRSDDDDDD